MRKESGSTYQYQVPSTSFQVLGTGTLIGLPMKPGSMMFCSHSTVALARVKLSEYSMRPISKLRYLVLLLL